MRGQAQAFWRSIQPETPYEISLKGGGKLSITFSTDVLNILRDPVNDVISCQFIRSIISTVSSRILAGTEKDNKIKKLVGSDNGPKEYEIKIHGDSRIFGAEKNNQIYFNRIEISAH